MRSALRRRDLAGTARAVRARAHCGQPLPVLYQSSLVLHSTRCTVLLQYWISTGEYCQVLWQVLDYGHCGKCCQVLASHVPTRRRSLLRRHPSSKGCKAYVRLAVDCGQSVCHLRTNELEDGIRSDTIITYEDKGETVSSPASASPSSSFISYLAIGVNMDASTLSSQPASSSAPVVPVRMVYCLSVLLLLLFVDKLYPCMSARHMGDHVLIIVIVVLCAGVRASPFGNQTKPVSLAVASMPRGLLLLAS